MVKTGRAEVILVGDELLKGERRDAHLSFLGAGLMSMGLRVRRAHAVGDDVEEIAATVRGAMSRAAVVIVTGGLGPTEDDVTRDGVAEGTGRELSFDEPSWRKIEAFFRERGVEPGDGNRRQATFPTGGEVIANNHGTAPGFVVEKSGSMAFVLPGPPQEMQPMWNAFVVPRLRERFGNSPLRVETFRTIGIGESQLVGMLGEGLWELEGYDVASLPSQTGVDLVLTARANAAPDALDAEVEWLSTALHTAIGNKFYERGRRSLAEVVGERLRERGETVAVAESLTGGIIGKLFTDSAGSSDFFLLDAVTYSNESKAEILGVRAETIEQFGAVSEEVCTEMAHGARNRAKATWGIATTGIAGPGGGTTKKPVGLTYIGIAWDGGSRIARRQYRGDRDGIRERASAGALWMLYDRIAAD